MLPQNRVPPQDPVRKAYLRLCARLARRPNEGPRDYGDRVLRRHPELGQQLRYGDGGAALALRRLQRLVRGSARNP